MSELPAVEGLDTCAISDALDRLGLTGATTGLRRMAAGAGEVVAGWAVTTRVTAEPPAGDAPHLGTLAVEAAGPDDIVVVDAGGRTAVSAWGGILSGAAAARGVRGVVVDGACRDVADARALGFPVFARAAVPVSARGRIWHESVGRRVSFAGVAVQPGDLVVADGNGVVFVARDRVPEVLAVATGVADAERRILARLRAGEPLSSLMRDPAREAR